MNGNFVSGVYKDEPLCFTTQQKKIFAPPEYQAMKKIATTMGSRLESRNKIFFDQARFMENFNDNFYEKGEFFSYFPTYQDMNDHQLRGYFSWRTKVRQGAVEKTSVSFVYVYIYELLNQIGVRSPEEGYQALKNFWLAYRAVNFNIDNHVKLWLKDYVVYNNLDKSLLDDLLITKFSDTLSLLFSYKSASDDEIFSALNSLSSYNIAKSRFFKQYPDDIKNVTCAVFTALSDYYEKKSSDEFCEEFFGKFYTRPYDMFRSAVFYDQIRYRDFVYDVNDFYKFKCKDGKWTCKTFFRYASAKKQHISILLKTIDYLMRQKYGFRPAIIVPADVTALQFDIIGKVINEYLEKQKESARPKIDIDVSKLQEIRRAALETQGKLLVAHDIEECAPLCRADERIVRVLGGVAPENDTGLNAREYLLMQCLLYNRPYDDLISSKESPLSMLVDAINEYFFDRFGDTVLVDIGERPELIADYVEELKEIISK